MHKTNLLCWQRGTPCSRSGRHVERESAERREENCVHVFREELDIRGKLKEKRQRQYNGD